MGFKCVFYMYVTILCTNISMYLHTLVRVFGIFPENCHGKCNIAFTAVVIKLRAMKNTRIYA